ncbi:hypothetical protein [Chryseobacterium pennipullorum]|uniref:Uncharacterized protein n=1 Tax=Chryseobacterium pennipullorum TaxID=2258963 RepID=A0A3D9AKL4_9FLAO|nr:hypothetical protein [Chryseobacterium pennipullorum]REC41831.1 hypothetical protein DRF67_21025 [Chryseobacterium pennipullorum]
MKTLFYIIIIFFPIVLNAQNNSEIKPSDSAGLVSRAFADNVLSKFDKIKAPKILYSLDNRYFYVIISNNPYREFYVVLDGNSVSKIEPIITELKTRKQRKQNKQYCKLLSKAEPLFDFGKYNKEFITKMPQATSISGRDSYFVLKDIDGKRYGEYNLSSITTPLPINMYLWTYLTKKLSDQMGNDTK